MPYWSATACKSIKLRVTRGVVDLTAVAPPEGVGPCLPCVSCLVPEEADASEDSKSSLLLLGRQVFTHKVKTGTSEVSKIDSGDTKVDAELELDFLPPQAASKSRAMAKHAMRAICFT